MDVEEILQRVAAGEKVAIWPGVELDHSALTVDGQVLPWNRIGRLARDAGGALVVHWLGAPRAEPAAVIPADRLPSEPASLVPALISAANRLVDAVPYLSRRTASGWPPGSIGDISARIGYDVRDLIVAGYSDRQISALVQGRMTLQELFATHPENPAQQIDIDTPFLVTCDQKRGIDAIRARAARRRQRRRS